MYNKKKQEDQLSQIDQRHMVSLRSCCHSMLKVVRNYTVR